MRTVKAVYKTFIDVIHFRKTDAKRLRGREGEDEEEDGVKKTFTAERVEQLKQLSRSPDIYDRLARALGGCRLFLSLVVSVVALREMLEILDHLYIHSLYSTDLQCLFRNSFSSFSFPFLCSVFHF